VSEWFLGGNGDFNATNACNFSSLDRDREEPSRAADA
jgi:hypothetical protein